MRSDLRWCSEGFEFTCWNGDTVRGAFVLDANDRQVIAWRAAADGGISGSDIRDMILEAVEARLSEPATKAKVAFWLTSSRRLRRQAVTRMSIDVRPRWVTAAPRSVGVGGGAAVNYRVIDAALDFGGGLCKRRPVRAWPSAGWTSLWQMPIAESGLGDHSPHRRSGIRLAPEIVKTTAAESGSIACGSMADIPLRITPGGESAYSPTRRAAMRSIATRVSLIRTARMPTIRPP